MRHRGQRVDVAVVEVVGLLHGWDDGDDDACQGNGALMVVDGVKGDGPWWCCCCSEGEVDEVYDVVEGIEL